MTLKFPAVGQAFGLLFFVEDAGPAPGRNRYWKMICQCGNSKVSRSDSIKRGTATSCGCAQKKASRDASMLDLAGAVYGRLTVLSWAGISKSCGSIWLCRCACGTEKTVTGHALRRGATVSCGCAKNDLPGLMPKEFLQKNNARTVNYRAKQANAGGSFSGEQVARLFDLQRGCCAWCAVALTPSFHRDHKVALHLGGSNDISNIELLCPTCNTRKSFKDQIAWANENGKLI